MNFEWDADKAASNLIKHKVSLEDAVLAFADQKRVITQDIQHSSTAEIRYFCYGMVDGRVMTVRFTIRDNNIRIIGAGYWRKGKKTYENQ